jgi:ribonuclease-3
VAGEAHRRRLRALLSACKLRGVEPEAVELAFVHESAVRDGAAERSNERLEFVGDAILGMIAARYLYDRYPDASEGELATRKSVVVSDAALAATATRLDFEPLMQWSMGLARMAESRRRSTLGDAFEALIAALAQAASPRDVEAFVIREHIEPTLATTAAIGDPKTMLQEWMQRRYATTPRYDDRAEGPAHERVFHSTVAIADDVRAEGTGATKKAAERAAAAAALAVLRTKFEDVPTGLALGPISAVRKTSARARSKKQA